MRYKRTQRELFGDYDDNCQIERENNCQRKRIKLDIDADSKDNYGEEIHKGCNKLILKSPSLLPSLKDN